MAYKDIEKRNAYLKKYRQTNKDKVEGYRKTYKNNHPNVDKEYYEKNKDKICAYSKERNKKRKMNPELAAMDRNRINNRNKLLRQEVLFHYGGNPPKCNCCGESIIEFLTIDHINNDGAEHRKLIKTSNCYSWLKRNNYPKSFQVLCFNCNMSKGLYGECPHKRNRGN